MRVALNNVLRWLKLQRKGYDLVHIAAIFGRKSLTATKRLVGGNPMRLADIMAGEFNETNTICC